ADQDGVGRRLYAGNSSAQAVTRLLPRSLIGQIILLMYIALLIAQLINFSVLLNREQRLSLAQSEGPAVARFVETASLVTRMGPGALPDGPPGFESPRPPGPPPFGRIR